MRSSLPDQSMVGQSVEELDRALVAWKDFDLEQVRPAIDREALTIQSYDELSREARANLATQVKSCRQLPDGPAKLAAMGDALRSFQKEVDSLTKRATFSELAFTKLYSALYTLPDPAPIIQRAVMDVSNKESVSSLQEKLAQYDAEFTKLKNQDVTVRKLEEQNRALEESIAAGLGAASNNLFAQFEDERSQMIEESQKKEQQLQYEIDRGREALAKSQLFCAELQAQLFSLREKRDLETIAKDNQSSMIIDELHRARAQINTLTHENASLAQTVRDRSSPISASLPQTNFFGDLEQKISSLTRDLEYSETECREKLAQVEKLQTALTVATEDNQSLQFAVKRLESQIADLPSSEEFEKVSRRCFELQAIQFNGIEDETEFTLSSLEEELVEKNRRLESDLTRLRVDLLTSNESLLAATSQLEQLTESNLKSSELIASLESSLASYTQIPRVLNLGLPRFAGSTEEPANSYQIVADQRDRYRQTAEALEAEKTSLSDQIFQLAQKVSTLQKDNEMLYQRLNAHQKYDASNRNDISDLESGRSERTVQKYKDIYEEKQNPFTQFNKAQKQTRIASMTLPERLTLTTAKTILGNKKLRAATFFYVIILHLLVFATLLTHTFTTHCKAKTHP